MPDLQLAVESVSVVPFAAAPTLSFSIRVSNRPPGEHVHSIALRCQIRIEATRRSYDPQKAALLLDLFGEPDRWSQTLRDMFWTHAYAHVPAFAGSTTVDLAVACTFDFNVAATKYFHGVPDGEIPLLFLFSGSVFYEGPEGSLQVYPVSWEKESRFRLPLATWREMMDVYHPNTQWLTLRRDVFDRLSRYKQRHGIATWDDVVERMLACAADEVPQ